MSLKRRLSRSKLKQFQAGFTGGDPVLRAIKKLFKGDDDEEMERKRRAAARRNRSS